MQDTINAMPYLQIILLWFKMNIRRAALVSQPDHLVDKLDNARFLVTLGNFLVIAEHRLEIILILLMILRQFIDRFRAHAVIFLVRLFNLIRGSKHELHRPARGKAHGIEQIRVERITHRHHEHAVIHTQGHYAMLGGHLGRNAPTRLRCGFHLAELNTLPIIGLGDVLQKVVFRFAALLAKVCG